MNNIVTGYKNRFTGAKVDFCIWNGDNKEQLDEFTNNSLEWRTCPTLMISSNKSSNQPWSVGKFNERKINIGDKVTKCGGVFNKDEFNYTYKQINESGL